MKKSNTLNKHYFLFGLFISILIAVISSLAIISLANQAFVIGQKSNNIISNPNGITNDGKSVKEIKKSLIQIDQSLKVNPNNITALIDKGRALGMLNKASEVIIYFDKALSISPNDVNALIQKGVALGQMHKDNEGIPYLDKALSISPNDVNALIDKGLLLGHLHRFSESILYFDKALSISPNDPLALEGKRVSLIGKELVTNGRH